MIVDLGYDPHLMAIQGFGPCEDIVNEASGDTAPLEPWGYTEVVDVKIRGLIRVAVNVARDLTYDFPLADRDHHQVPRERQTGREPLTIEVVVEDVLRNVLRKPCRILCEPMGRDQFRHVRADLEYLAAERDWEIRRAPKVTYPANGCRGRMPLKKSAREDQSPA